MSGSDQVEENVRTVQQIVDVWGGDDLDALDDVVAEDVVVHLSGVPEPVRGREEYKESIDAYRSAFPDLTPEVNDVVAADDRVVVHYTARGTHEGELMGIEPTGNAVEVPGIILARLEDGEVVEETNIGDLLALFRQLGVVELSEGP